MVLGPEDAIINKSDSLECSGLALPLVAHHFESLNQPCVLKLGDIMTLHSLHQFTIHCDCRVIFS